jgi:hypothetical protein
MSDVQGVFEQAVLIAVATLDREASGAMILAEVRERLKRNIHWGSVHSTLQRPYSSSRMVSHTIATASPAIRPK